MVIPEEPVPHLTKVANLQHLMTRIIAEIDRRMLSSTRTSYKQRTQLTIICQLNIGSGVAAFSERSRLLC